MYYTWKAKGASGEEREKKREKKRDEKQEGKGGKTWRGRKEGTEVRRATFNEEGQSA